MDQMRGMQPFRLKLSTRGGEVERRAGPGEPAARSPVAVRDSRDGVRIRWSDPAIKGVMVRDARTGAILSFGRDGEALVSGTSSEIELTVSDGVRSTRSRVSIPSTR
jgi:hypothetical protein